MQKIKYYPDGVKQSVQLIALCALLWMFSNGCRFKSAAAGDISSSTKSADATPKVRESRGIYNYNLASYSRKWALPDPLLEISGNAWVGKDHLLVIEDFHPLLYLLKLDGDKVVVEKTIAFKNDPGERKVDIEDIAVDGETAFAMRSNGTIYKVNDWKTNPKVEEFATFLSGKNNTEGIAFEPATKTLLVSCKDDPGVDDAKKSTKAVYRFDLSGKAVKRDPFMLIEEKELKKIAGNKMDFFPSSITVHPKTGDIYILSTRGTKCMAIFSKDGMLKSIQDIGKEEMIQPEGICFAPDGTLYISTEGRNDIPAYLYEFLAK